MARILRSRSLIAATAAAVAIVVVVALTGAGAATRPDLAPIPAGRLISSSAAAIADRSPTMFGTFETHVDVGIPQLPGVTSAQTGPLGLLTSDQTFKVWRSSQGVRIAQILPSAERDVFVTPTDAWFWDSAKFTAWHAALTGLDIWPPTSLGDLNAVVSGALSKLAPYAHVTTAAPVEVAGRPAYVVRLTPETTGTLVGHVDVAIDAQTRVPLRLAVFASGASAPVATMQYASVSFAPVDPAVFRFSPPAGATVHQVHPKAAAHEDAGEMGQGMPDVRWFGSGFGLIAAVPVPSVPKQLAPLFPYHGPLGSADVVRRGDRTWVVAGLVPPEALAKVEPNLR